MIAAHRMLFNPVPDQQSASATSSIRSSSPDRPSLRGARSFSRLEPSTTNPLSRLGGELTIPDISKTVSETPSPIEEHDEEDSGKEPSSTSFPEGFDELPIELLSLTDRFAPLINFWGIGFGSNITSALSSPCLPKSTPTHCQ